MGLGFDWNGDGKDGLFDDMVTLHVLDKSQKQKKGGGNNKGSRGSCAVSVLAVPALLVGIILKEKGGL